MLQANIKQLRQTGKKLCSDAPVVPLVEKPKKSKAVPSLEQPLDDERILKLMITGPTNEPKPRIQITAKTASNGRLFVCTLHVLSCPRHNEIVEAMKSLADQGEASKKALLEIRYTFL